MSTLRSRTQQNNKGKLIQPQVLNDPFTTDANKSFVPAWVLIQLYCTQKNNKTTQYIFQFLPLAKLEERVHIVQLKLILVSQINIAQHNPRTIAYCFTHKAIFPYKYGVP